MQSLTITQAKEYMREIAIKRNVAVMNWGQPGLGKTAMIGQLADELGATLCDVRASQWDSVDFRGFPEARDGRTFWAKPGVLPFKGNEDQFNPDKPVILHLDEINSATPPVFAVLMQLLHERRVGEHQLMDSVRVLAAGNRESDRGVANRMPTTIANRLNHVETVVDVNSYVLFRQSRECLPMEIAFYKFRGAGLLNNFDPDKPSKTFATPRSSEQAWEFYADALLSDEIKQAAMMGAVGDGIAAEILGFNDIWAKIVPLKKILADPANAPIPSDAAVQYATAVNVSGSINATNHDKLHTYLLRMKPELAVMAWNLAFQRDKNLSLTSSFASFAVRFTDIW